MWVLLPDRIQSPPSRTARRFHRLERRARVLLADALGEDDLAGRDAAQPLLLLLVGAPVEQPSLSLRRDLAGHQPVPADLFGDDGVLGYTSAQTAPLSWDERAEVAEPAEFAVQVARELVGPVRGVQRGAVLLAEGGEFLRRGVDPLLLRRVGAQDRIHQDSSRTVGIRTPAPRGCGVLASAKRSMRRAPASMLVMAPRRDLLGDQPADLRRLHQTVAGEAARVDPGRRVRRRAEDAVMVRGVLVRAGPAPAAIQRDVGEPGEAADPEFEQRFQPRPVDVDVVAVDLVGPGAAEQQPRTLAAQVDPGAEVHRHRQRRRQRAGCGRVDVAPRVHDRYVEAGQRGDLAGPAAGGVDEVLGGDGTLARAHRPTAVGVLLDRSDRSPIGHRRAAVAGELDPGAGHQVRVDDAVRGSPGHAAQTGRLEGGDLLGGVEGQDLDRDAVRALPLDGVQLRRPQRIADEQQVAGRPVADVDAVRGREVAEGLDAAPGQLDVQVVGPLAADGGERPAGASRGRPVQGLDDRRPAVRPRRDGTRCWRRWHRPRSTTTSTAVSELTTRLRPGRAPVGAAVPVTLGARAARRLRRRGGTPAATFRQQSEKALSRRARYAASRSARCRSSRPARQPQVHAGERLDAVDAVVERGAVDVQLFGAERDVAAVVEHAPGSDQQVGPLLGEEHVRAGVNITGGEFRRSGDDEMPGPERVPGRAGEAGPRPQRPQRGRRRGRRPWRDRPAAPVGRWCARPPATGRRARSCRWAGPSLRP